MHLGIGTLGHGRPRGGPQDGLRDGPQNQRQDGPQPDAATSHGDKHGEKQEARR